MRLYNVKFHAHTGISFDLGEAVEFDEAQRIVRLRLKRARAAGSPVSRLTGHSWEVEERDDIFIIGDDVGILSVRRHRQARRRRFLR